MLIRRNLLEAAVVAHLLNNFGPLQVPNSPFKRQKFYPEVVQANAPLGSAGSWGTGGSVRLPAPDDDASPALKQFKATSVLR